MTEYTKEQILSRVEELGEEQSWNHDIDLPFGIKTIGQEQVSHGKNRVKWERIENYIRKIDISGKRVLDVGCNEGFFSLKLAEMGAKEVVGIDADKLRLNKAEFVSEVLGVENVRYELVDIFDDCIEKYGYFDFILCMGFLHRIPYPYQAISQLAKLSDMILFELKALKEGDHNSPIMKYCGGVSKDSNKFSGLYWLPSISCIESILEELNFSHRLVVDDSTWRRALVIASKCDHTIFSENDLTDISKLKLLKSITRSYLSSILKTCRDKKNKWL